MTIISSTSHPVSRLQFVGQETDLGVKSTIMSLWPDLEIAHWRMTAEGDIGFPVAVGFTLTEVVSNPGDAQTLWTDGTALYFGATVINNGSGADLTGSITTTQVAYGVGANTVAGDAGFTYSVAAHQLQLLSSSAALPAYSFVGDTDTGLYNVSANSLGLSAGGAVRLTVDTAAVTSALPLLGVAGSNTAPSVAFSGDTNTGLYSVGADDLGITVGGTLRVDISTTALTSTLPVFHPAGAVGAPSISFAGDTNTGLYNISSDVLGLTTGGVLRLGISPTALVSTVIGIFPASTTSIASIRLTHGVAPSAPVDGDLWTTTVGVFAQINGVTVGPFGVSGGNPGGADTQVQFNDGGTTFGGDAGFTYDKTNDQLRLSPDTAALPSYSFVGDLNTGMYEVGADNIGFSTGGTLRVDISTTVLTSTLPFRGAAGSNTAPSVSFSSDTNTGLYSVGADDLGITTGGTLRLDISTTALTSTLPFLGQAGSAAAPSLTFSGDADTGLYDVGANDLGFATNGVLRVDISTTAVTSTLPFLGAAGSDTAPSLSFSGDTNTGLYSVGADDLGITTGGALRVSVSTTALTSTLPFLGADGSAGAPSISFANDPNTGLYSASANDLAFATDGVLRFDISTAAVTSTLPILAAAGSAGAPSISFSGDTNTGLYSVGADDLGITVAGTLRVDVSTTAITSTLPFLGANGSNTAPSLSFASDTNTGLYNITADDLGIATGGTLRVDISTTAVTSTLPFLGAAGSNAAPSISFSGDTNTGLYSVGADDLGITTGGTLRLDVSTTAVTSTLPFLGAAGSNTAPSISFASDSNTGLYSIGADELGVTIGGTLRLDISTTSITATLPFLGAGGSNAAPSISFSADADTGMYLVGSDDLGFATNGTLRFDISSTTATFATDVLISGILAGFLADIVVVSGTSLMLSSAHQGRVIRFTSGSSVAVTMPNSLPIGFSCTITQDGAGVVTTSAGSGATVNNRQSKFATAGQYAVASLVVLANAGGSSAIATIAGDLA